MRLNPSTINVITYITKKLQSFDRTCSHTVPVIWPFMLKGMGLNKIIRLIKNFFINIYIVARYLKIA